MALPGFAGGEAECPVEGDETLEGVVAAAEDRIGVPGQHPVDQGLGLGQVEQRSAVKIQAVEVDAHGPLGAEARAGLVKNSKLVGLPGDQFGMPDRRLHLAGLTVGLFDLGVGPGFKVSGHTGTPP